MEFNDLKPQSCWNTAQQCRRGPAYLICLTISAGGLQVVWAAIQGQGSLFLSNLGISTYAISFIWLAGPLSGVLIQPYISVLSDHSCHSWGRRRPFILLGAIFTIIPMVLLPWTREIASVLTHDFSSEPHNEGNITVQSLVAGSFVWGLNISIQPLQVGIRALVVDSCPAEQQMQAAAYVSRITAVGSILGYTLGFINLPSLFPWLGNTQYQCVFSFASLVLILSVAITCSVIQENGPLKNGQYDRSIGVVAVFRQVLLSARLMPKSMKSVCKIQFCSWLGWFSFLFYITTYLEKAYEREGSGQSMADGSYDQKTSEKPKFVQHGAMAMVIFATMSFVSNLLLPLIITTNSSSLTASNRTALVCSADANLQLPLGNAKPSRWSTARFRIKVPRLSLSRAWAASHVFSSIVLFTTIFTQSSSILTAQVSLLGISWAMTQWAPLALISTQMSNYESVQNDITKDMNSTPCHIDCDCDHSNIELLDCDCSGDDANEKIALEDDDPPNQLHAGVVMGIYNASIATPQIIAAIGSSCLFWILDRLGIDDGEAVGWVIRVGGLSSLAAAWLAQELEGE